jgi:hypothetical protein
MKYDLQFMSEHLGNQLRVISKCEHILKLYDLNKPRPFCQLYKLTDTHLYPATPSVMKVKLAAQAMSHSIAASINTLVATGNDHCTPSYALYYFMKVVANENNEG